MDACSEKFNTPNGYNGCWLVSILDVLHTIKFLASNRGPLDAHLEAALRHLGDASDSALANETVRECQISMKKRADSAAFDEELQKILTTARLLPASCGVVWRQNGSKVPEHCVVIEIRQHWDQVESAVCDDKTPGKNITEVLQLMYDTVHSVGSYALVNCDHLGTCPKRYTIDISGFVHLKTDTGSVALRLIVVVARKGYHFVRYILSGNQWVLRNSLDNETVTCTTVVFPSSLDAFPVDIEPVLLVYKNTLSPPAPSLPAACADLPTPIQNLSTLMLDAFEKHIPY